MGDAMANLEEMREFQRHWRAFGAEDLRLFRLCHRVPVDVSKLSEEDRSHDLFSEPASVAYRSEGFAAVLADALVAPATSGEDGAGSWGWWFGDDSWATYASTEELLRERDDVLGQIRALDAERQAAIDADDDYQKAVSAADTYRLSNSEDVASREELSRRLETLEEGYREAHGGDGGVSSVPRSALRAGSAAVALVCAVLFLLVPDAVLAEPARIALVAAAVAVCALVGLGVPQRLVGSLRRWRWISDERDRLGRSITDIDQRIALRADELKVRSEEAEARRLEIAAPFEDPRAELLERRADIERRIIAALEDDLAHRDPAFDEGSLDGLSFDEAFRSAQKRIWNLLGAWMDAYLAALPREIDHAENARASEEVWLEAHDPFGRRHWSLTDEVVSLMEEGGASDSGRALELVLAGER